MDQNISHPAKGNSNQSKGNQDSNPPLKAKFDHPFSSTSFYGTEYFNISQAVGSEPKKKGVRVNEWSFIQTPPPTKPNRLCLHFALLMSITSNGSDTLRPELISRYSESEPQSDSLDQDQDFAFGEDIDERLNAFRVTKSSDSEKTNEGNNIKSSQIKPYLPRAALNRLNNQNFKVPMTPKKERCHRLISQESMFNNSSEANTCQASVSLTPAQRTEKHNTSERSSPTKSVSVLTSYSFENLIGRGASAKVFRAVNLVTNREVAVKQIEISKKSNFDSLMSEINLLKVLKNEHIVKYHGYVRTSSTLNIFLEYCSGGSLRSMYKKAGKPFGEPKVKEYTRQTLLGLEYLHSQGVIHRDIKAANLLLTDSGHVKLADFGVAAEVVRLSNSAVSGSPYWMAPEVILLQGCSTASDIWSLGATVLELLTMHPPFDEFQPMAACHAIGTEDSPPIPGDISKWAKDFLQQCFQKNPGIRISADRLLHHAWLKDSPDEEDWETGFADVKINFNKALDKRRQSSFYARSDLLKQSSDTSSDDFSEIAEQLEEKKLSLHLQTANDDVSQRLEIATATTEDTHAEARVDWLVAHFSVDNPSLGDITAEALSTLCSSPSLVKSSFVRKIQDILQKYEIVDQTTLKSLLSILEIIFTHKESSLRTFCMVGGIPLLLKLYRHVTKHQVTRLFLIIVKSKDTLPLFVACGGIQITSDLVQSDDPALSEVGIEALYCILVKDLQVSRSELCDLFLNECLLDWISLRIPQLATNTNGFGLVLSILEVFQKTDVKTKQRVPSPALFRALFDSYDSICDIFKTRVLRFVSSLSSVACSLEPLHVAGALGFCVNLLKQNPPSKSGFEKFVTPASLVLFNMCHLNCESQSEICLMGAIPLLQTLSLIRLPFREHVVLLLCELVNCSKIVRTFLWRSKALSGYLKLLINPSWQCHAMDAIVCWRTHDPELIEPKLLEHADYLRNALLTPNICNFEKSSQGFLQLLSIENMDKMLFSWQLLDVLIENVKCRESEVLQVAFMKIAAVLMRAKLKADFGCVKRCSDCLAKLDSIDKPVLVLEMKKGLERVMSRYR